jgi:hypothetical protein
MKTCSAMPLSVHMLLPNKEFNSGTMPIADREEDPQRQQAVKRRELLCGQPGRKSPLE